MMNQYVSVLNVMKADGKKFGVKLVAQINDDCKLQNCQAHSIILDIDNHLVNIWLYDRSKYDELRTIYTEYMQSTYNLINLINTQIKMGR